MVQNETLETTKKRMRWENEDYICRGHILNGMSDSLFDIYQNAESAKALWESLESKYIAEDASAKKFLVSNFMNYKMVDTRPVMEQYHEMLRILGQYTQHNLMMDDAISVAVIIDKLPPSWKEFKHGKNQIRSSSDNMVEGDEAKNFNNNKNKRKFKSGDDKFANKKGTMTCWKCKKTIHMKKDCLSRKGNDGVGSNGSKDPEKQQEPNDYVSMNSIIESKDAIFDEERFKSIPRPRGMIQPSSSKIAKDQVEDKTLSQREYCFIIKEDPRTLSEAMASRDVAFWNEAIQRCKWILKSKMKVNGSIDKYKARLVIQGFRQKEGIDFFDTYAPVARISTIRLLLALAAIYDLVIYQMDVKTAFLNGDFDEEIYMKQPEGFVMPGHESKVCKLKKLLYGLKQAPKQWHQKFDDVVLSNGFSLNQADKCVYSKFDASGEAKVILGIRIKQENNGTLVSQLEYLRAIGCLMYAMISFRPDIAFAVGKLSRYTSNPSALHWQALGDAISWASKKQTCITSSTIEFEFVTLAAAGNKAGRLRNLVYEIPLWPKPISTISIRCDSAATLAKAYSQVYNGKSRHLANHLTKGLARDLVCKAAIGVCLKST
nr:zinc finger, CCHC-type [Tanacetum cinerariifolium]